MKVNLFGTFWPSDNNSNYYSAETGGEKTTQNVVNFLFILAAEKCGNIKYKVIENIIL